MASGFLVPFAPSLCLRVILSPLQLAQYKISAWELSELKAWGFPQSPLQSWSWIQEQRKRTE